MATLEENRSQLNKLSTQAREYQNASRKRLEKELGLRGPLLSRRPPSSGNPFGMPKGPSGVEPYAGSPRMGVSPSDPQVQQWINQQGGNPFMQQFNDLKATMARDKREAGQKTSGAVSRKLNKNVQETEQSVLEKFFEEAQQAQDDANAANEERYGDILGRLEDRYGRGQEGMSDFLGQLEGNLALNQEQIDNYGVAAAADLEERFSENIGNVAAGLSGRGLGNSTIIPAFESRNARDLAREQQRLSETVDTRSLDLQREQQRLMNQAINKQIDLDSSLSGDVASFMERRNDVGPNFNQLAQLAMRLGEGNSGQGFQQTPNSQPGYRPAQQPAYFPYGGYGNQRASRNVLSGFVDPSNPFGNFGAQQPPTKFTGVRDRSGRGLNVQDAETFRQNKIKERAGTRDRNIANVEKQRFRRFQRDQRNDDQRNAFQFSPVNRAIQNGPAAIGQGIANVSNSVGDFFSGLTSGFNQSQPAGDSGFFYQPTPDWMEL